MHFEYHAIENNLEMYISVNNVMVFDTVFSHTTVGFYDFIVVEPE